MIYATCILAMNCYLVATSVRLQRTKFMMVFAAILAIANLIGVVFTAYEIYPLTAQITLGVMVSIMAITTIGLAILPVRSTLVIKGAISSGIITLLNVVAFLAILL